MKFLILLSISLFIIIVSAAFVKYKNLEPFTTDDYYSQYLSDITIHPDFYAQGVSESNWPLAELNDKFFTDALKENLQSKVADNLDKIDTNDKSNIKDLLTSIISDTNLFLVKILNDKLESISDTKLSELFKIKYGEITSITSYKNNLFLTISQHIVHRDKKIYGASIELKTLHNLNKKTIALIDYKLLGFVFDDRIGIQQPSNLSTDNFQEFMKDKVPIDDIKEDNMLLCKHFKDLQSDRNISPVFNSSELDYCSTTINTSI